MTLITGIEDTVFHSVGTQCFTVFYTVLHSVNSVGLKLQNRVTVF